jgi:hypothetical protein
MTALRSIAQVLKAPTPSTKSVAPLTMNRSCGVANEAVEQATDKTYYGLTLSQHAERIRKLATERGLTGEVFDRVTAKAVEMIPTIRLNDGGQR